LLTIRTTACSSSYQQGSGRCRHLDRRADGDTVREVVQDGAVGGDGLLEAAVVPFALRAGQADPELDALEAGAHALLGTEEAGEVDVPLELDVDAVEGQVELARPYLVADDGARRERREEVLDRVRTLVGAAERVRLVDGELVGAGGDGDLGRRAPHEGPVDGRGQLGALRGGLRHGSASWFLGLW